MLQPGRTPLNVGHNELANYSLWQLGTNADLSRITRKYASATWTTLFAINVGWSEGFWRRRWDSNPLRPALQADASTTSASPPQRILYPESILKSIPKLPSYRLFTPPLPFLNYLNPRVTNGNGGFCRPLPYHLATAPWLQGPIPRAEQLQCERSIQA